MKWTLCAIFLLLAGAADAGEKIIYRCSGTAEQCRHMPAPPAPPAPPAAPSLPAPPAPPGGLVLPAPPAPPAPPPPPEAPEVPAAAHAACKDQPPGTKMTFRPNNRETIKGTCRRGANGMELDLNSWTVEN